jgi:hypothetical protein
MMEALSSSETSVLTRATRSNSPEVTILRVQGAFSPGVSEQGREAHQSPPSCDDVAGAAVSLLHTHIQCVVLNYIRIWTTLPCLFLMPRYWIYCTFPYCQCYQHAGCPIWRRNTSTVQSWKDSEILLQPSINMHSIQMVTKLENVILLFNLILEMFWHGNNKKSCHLRWISTKLTVFNWHSLSQNCQ